MTEANEQNLDKIRELRRQHELKEQADVVNSGSTYSSSVFIDYTTVFGTKVSGWVEFQRPGMADYMKMGGLKSEYLRKAGVVDIALVDPTIKFMAQVMSTLKVVIRKYPEWLVDLDGVKEPDILYHVYGQYEKWESSFRKVDTPELEGDSEPTE